MKAMDFLLSTDYLKNRLETYLGKLTTRQKNELLAACCTYGNSQPNKIWTYEVRNRAIFAESHKGKVLTVATDNQDLPVADWYNEFKIIRTDLLDDCLRVELVCISHVPTVEELDETNEDLF